MGKESKADHLHTLSFRCSRFAERLFRHGFHGTGAQKRAYWRRLGRRLTGRKQELPAYPAVSREQHHKRILEELSRLQNAGEPLPLISVIVLTCNGLAMNRDCIRSILQNTVYPGFELLIVDNGSADGTPEWLRTLKDPRVRVIFNENNLGFAAGINAGIRNARGTFFALLNNDVVVPEGWLLRLYQHFAGKESLALCGPTTDATGNEARIPFPAYDRSAFPDERAFQYAFSCMDRGEKVLYAPDSLMFFAVLIRGDVIREKTGKLPLLDERFGTGLFEDDDFCRQVRELGLTLELAEDSFVFHRERESFSKMADVDYIRLFQKNRRIYENKWGEKWIPHRMRG